MNYHDFAGSGAIHFTAAIGALVVTVALKPRKNRFDPKYEDSFKPANPLYICLSCLTVNYVLIFSSIWLGCVSIQVQH